MSTKGLADPGFWSVTLGAWCYGLSLTIATALLPQMQGDLSVGLDQVTWVVTSAVVASAIGIPPTPWLAARFGSKNLLVASLLLFTFSSAMIGGSGTLGEVVFWRICQAFFGAPIFVLSQSVTIDLFPDERRGRAMAVWSVALTTGWTFGPTIGAYLADWYDWRASFFVITPLSILATISCAVCLDRVEEDKGLDFDWIGFTTLSLVLLATQMALNRGQRLDWLESGEIAGWLALAAFALSIYVGHAFTSWRRFIRWEVMRDWNLCFGLLLTCLLAVLSLAPMVLIPPMLESLKGLEVITIGLVFVFRGTVQIVAMLLIGPVVGRGDPRWLCALGFLSFAIGCRIVAGYSPDIGLRDIYLPQVYFGVGIALMWMPVFHMLYATVGAELRNDAATLVSLTYNVVSSAGVALIVALFSRSLQINTAELGAHVYHANERLLFPEYALFDLGKRTGLASVQAEIGQQALAIGYANMFWLMMWVSLAALPLLVLLPYRRPPGAQGPGP